MPSDRSPNTRIRALTAVEQREYDRAMLRSAVASVLTVAAQGLGKKASQRWFVPARRNFTLDELANVANRMGIEIEVRAVDRKSGAVFGAYGRIA